jgi:alpha-amylase
VEISKEFSKIDEGYFDKLGINAIWFTPIVEQIHDA